MSTRATSWAWDQHGLGAPAKMVLLALAEFADREDNSCFPSRKTLAAECELSVATVSRALKILAEAGLIEWDNRYRDNGSRTSSRYILRCAPRLTLTPPPSHSDTTPVSEGDPHNLSDEQVEKEDPPTPLRGEVDRVWERFVAMRQRSPKKLRRAELDSQTRRMVQKALEVGSEDEWLRAVDALLLSRHHVGQNDRRKVYLEPRHVFTACTHGTVRGHLDWLLDLAPQTAVGAGVSAFTSSDDAVKIRQAKLNVLRAFDLAGSDEARRKGDESERRLLEHGIRVVRRPGERPSFEEQDEPEQGRLLGDDS